MKPNERVSHFIFLCTVVMVVVYLLALWACASEPVAMSTSATQSQWVRVTVKTGTTINSGTGFYLGRGVVAAERQVAQGSTNMRARVTFPSGASYLGTIVFNDKRPNLCFIKLDHRPDRDSLKLVGRYHYRGRTARFFRRVA